MGMTMTPALAALRDAVAARNRFVIANQEPCDWPAYDEAIADLNERVFNAASAFLIEIGASL